MPIFHADAATLSPRHAITIYLFTLLSRHADAHATTLIAPRYFHCHYLRHYFRH
jgi:hypothetical protein